MPPKRRRIPKNTSSPLHEPSFSESHMPHPQVPDLSERPTKKQRHARCIQASTPPRPPQHQQEPIESRSEPEVSNHGLSNEHCIHQDTSVDDHVSNDATDTIIAENTVSPRITDSERRINFGLRVDYDEGRSICFGSPLKNCQNARDLFTQTLKAVSGREERLGPDRDPNKAIRLLRFRYDQTEGSPTDEEGKQIHLAETTVLDVNDEKGFLNFSRNAEKYRKRIGGSPIITVQVQLGSDALECFRRWRGYKRLEDS